MINAWLTNRWFLFAIVTLLVFLEMIPVKYWYISWTKKIENQKVRKAVNLLLGLVSCFALAAFEMWAACDLFDGTFYWRFVVAAAIGATGLYLCYEKVFKDSELTAIGKVVDDVLSHSKLFEGKVSAKGLKAFRQKLSSIVEKIDTAKANEENKAIDEAVAKLGAIVEDGQVTEAEKAEADKLLATHSNAIAEHPTVARYYELLHPKK